MSDNEAVKYFAQKIQWISSTIEAMLKGTPVPPATDQPGGKVGMLMESIKELAARYKKLEKQVNDFTEKEQDFANALGRLQAQSTVDVESSSKAAAQETEQQRSERRIEDLISTNHALKSHIQTLTEQLSASKEILSSKSQLQQRLSLRELELRQLSEKKDKLETLADDLKKQMADMSERLRGETDAFQSIAKIGAIMSIVLEPEEVLKRVCQIPRDFIGCLRSATYLMDADSDSFMPIHSSGMQTALVPVFKASRFRQGDMPLLSELVSRKRPIAVDDCRKVPYKARVCKGDGSMELIENSSPFLTRDFVERHQTYSLLAIPFVSKGSVSGIMFVDYGGIKHPFSDREIAIMDDLGQLIGAALDNIRNYQETSKRLLGLQHQAGMTTVLKEIEEAIYATNEAEQIIGTVIRMIPRVVGCEWVSVLLADPLAKGFYILGNLDNLIRGKGTIPFEHTNFNGVLRADQVLHRSNLQNERNLSPLDLHLVSHGIGSDLLLPISISGEIRGVLHVSSRRVAGFSHEDIHIVQKISRQLADALHRATAQRVQDRRKGNGYFETIRSLLETVSQKDFRLGDYRDQMIDCGLGIARRFDLDEEQQEWIKYAIVLHDVGKSMVPDHILNKKEVLTEKEMAVLRTHPIQGAEMIKNFRFSELIEGMRFVKFVVPMVRHSYEHWDGTGYPDGLSGQEIPQGSRILSVVNASAAMMMDRPYRRALRVEEAILEIRNGSGSQFDPQVVDHFFRYFQEQHH